MKLFGYTIDYPPTSDNYSKTVFPIGVSRRTLSGKADVHVRAVKYHWVITIPEQGLEADIFSYLDGTEFSFTDIDTNVYTVVLTGAVPISGYPSVAEIVLTLEEV